MSALKRVTFARSGDKTKPNLAGVILEPAGPGQVFAAATDGFMLAFAILNLDEPKDNMESSRIIPSKLAEEIGKVQIRPKALPAHLEITEKSAWLHRPGLPSLTMPWIQGTYPAWRKVIPAPDSLCPLVVGRFTSGCMEKASKALGNEKGFASVALSSKSGGGAAIAEHDGVCVCTMPMIYASGHEEILLDDVKRYLGKVNAVDKASKAA